MIHLCQLSLFSMICRLQGNLLNRHAVNIFTSSTNSKGSWFNQIERWCSMYGLPHPSSMLATPLEKAAFKRLVRSKVVGYWEEKLRHEAASLKSLTSYFHPKYMSLTFPHPIWTTAGSSPAKVAMATIQALMLSVRYRCDSLVHHWSLAVTGFCTMSPNCQNLMEDLQHMLQFCPSLDESRRKLYLHTESCSKALSVDARTILLTYCDPKNDHFTRFVVDCSTFPEVIAAVQRDGPDLLSVFFDVTRVWTYVLHRDRLRLRGQWRPGA